MMDSRQRWLVITASLGLSALVLGIVGGGIAVRQTLETQLQDPEFLRQQLQTVDGPSDREASEPPPALIRVSRARREMIQPVRSIVGRFTEVRRVTLASEVTGKIVELPVELGTPVVADQTVIVRIDTIWSRLALARGEAQLASTQAQLEYQQDELQRGEQLSEKDAITESELTSLRATVTELQARLAEARVVLDEESERISRSVITAPFDGTVVEKHVELGGHLAPGDPVVDIVSRGQIDTRLMVPESVVNRIQLNQTLEIRVDALDEAFPGRVLSITPYGPSASRTFPVRVRLDDQGGRLKAGMSATAVIATADEHEALVVHKDAVLTRPDGSTVWVALDGGTADTAEVQAVPVVVQVRSRQDYAVEAETESGRQLLSEGEAVVIEGAERLTSGQRVRIIGRDGEVDVAGGGDSDAADVPPTPATAAHGSDNRQET